MAGDITDRITANVADNLYFNKGAFCDGAGRTSSATRRARCPACCSPWRNNVDLSVSKTGQDRRQHVGLDAASKC